MTSYWHPFADMGAVEAGGELAIVRGEGAYVFDRGGTRYFDATARLWYCNVGHGRAEIADAAARQLRELAAYNNYGDPTTPAASELAERVAVCRRFAKPSTDSNVDPLLTPRSRSLRTRRWPNSLWGMSSRCSSTGSRRSRPT